jgi:hypothetical protein
MSDIISPLKRMRVSPDELRKKFKAGNYMERVKSGELHPELVADGHPAPPRSHQPLCTRSQFISHYDKQRNKLFSVHQYKRRDGTTVGLPDPKEILDGDTILFV